MTFKIRSGLLRCAVLTLSVALPASAFAASDRTGRAIESDGAERLYQSSRLKTLGKRVAASTCLANAGVATNVQMTRIAEDVRETDTIIHALESGNQDRGIHGPETSRKLRQDLATIRADWGPYRQHIEQAVLSGDIDPTRSTAFELSEALLVHTMDLLWDMSAVYAHPFEVSKQDAMAIKIAGRARRVSQQLMAQACMLWLQPDRGEWQDALNELVVLQENLILALRDGHSALGLNAAPTSTLEAHMQSAFTHWERAKPLLNNTSIGHAERAEVAQHMNDLLAELDLATAE